MKKINFIYFCEDLAHREFIEAYFKKIPIYFGVNIEFILTIPDGFEILKEDHDCFEITSAFKDFYYRIKANTQIDLFVYGRDADTDSEKIYTYLENSLEIKEVENPLHLLFLAVRSVEHWFLYIKSNDSTLVPNCFDIMDNKTAKREFYGNSRPTLKIRQKHIPQICKKLDIDFLKSKSDSFKAFLEKTEEIIQKLK